MRKDRQRNRDQRGFMTAATAVMIMLGTFFHFAAKGQTSATITQAGWYRIGLNGTTLGGGNGNRAAAHFIVMDKTSSQHQTIEFLAYTNYNLMPSIVVLNNSYYGSSHIPIPKIRIVTGTPYAGTAIEVYIAPITGYSCSESFVIEDNTQSNGWTAINWQQVSTASGDQDGVPSGFTASVLNLKDLVTGFVTKSGTQSSYVNGNFFTSGNILLGKTSQANTAYKLDINGKARANEVVVNSTGADFVFDSSYRLPSLNNVEEYIETHHHLPDIPSAKEMQAKGLSLGEGQTKLLQKVEELTLYLLHMQSEMDSLKQRNGQLERQNKELGTFEQRLRKLEAKSEIKGPVSAQTHPITVKTSQL